MEEVIENHSNGIIDTLWLFLCVQMFCLNKCWFFILLTRFGYVDKTNLIFLSFASNMNFIIYTKYKKKSFKIHFSITNRLKMSIKYCLPSRQHLKLAHCVPNCCLHNPYALRPFYYLIYLNIKDLRYTALLTFTKCIFKKNRMLITLSTLHAKQRQGRIGKNKSVLKFLDILSYFLWIHFE